MFVFKPNGDYYIIGFYDPDGKWITSDSRASADEAEKLVNYLNGGNISAQPKAEPTLLRLGGENLRLIDPTQIIEFRYAERMGDNPPAYFYRMAGDGPQHLLKLEVEEAAPLVAYFNEKYPKQEEPSNG